MKILKKALFGLTLLFLLFSSCSKEEEILDLNENEVISIEYKIDLESSNKDIILKVIDGDIVKDSGFEAVKNFIKQSEELTVLDLGNNNYKLFRDLKNAKNHYKNSIKSNNLSRSLIFGEATLFDGFNSTGTNTTFRVGYGTPKITWSLSKLKYAKQQYNTNGTSFGSIRNLDNKVSSIRLRNYAMAILYSEENFKIYEWNFGLQRVGVFWAFANNPDIFGNPYERNINLSNNPINYFISGGPIAQNNSASSVMVTCDVN